MKERAVVEGRRSAVTTYLWAAAVSAAVGFGAVYVTLGRPDNAGRAPPAADVAVDRSAAAGAMAAFVYKKAAETVPEVAFADGAGNARTLADFRGKTLLVNLWATWCTPCREEMPSLERLQKELGSDRFQVVALSIDRAGADAARKFLHEIGVAGLDLYIDKTGRAGMKLKAFGMPTTILIDPDGHEIGRLVGPASWDSADAKRLVTAALR